MLPRTSFLSRLMGLYCLICGLTMIVHREAFLDAMAKLTSDPAALLCVSVSTVIAGLALVLAHNLWTSPPAVIVSLVGWITLIKGTFYLLLPSRWLAGFSMAVFNSDRYFYLETVLLLALGAYLTYEGFRSKPAKALTSA
jgi:hypothetical protein